MNHCVRTLIQKIPSIRQLMELYCVNCHEYGKVIECVPNTAENEPYWKYKNPCDANFRFTL